MASLVMVGATSKVVVPPNVMGVQSITSNEPGAVLATTQSETPQGNSEPMVMVHSAIGWIICEALTISTLVPPPPATTELGITVNPAQGTLATVFPPKTTFLSRSVKLRVCPSCRVIE